MFYSWLVHWRCWKQSWCGLSLCCIQVTLRVMTTAIRTRSASPKVPRDEHTVCCRQCAGAGGRHLLVGQSRQGVTGWSTRQNAWLNVSVGYMHTRTLYWHICVFVKRYVTLFVRFRISQECVAQSPLNFLRSCRTRRMVFSSHKNLHFCCRGTGQPGAVRDWAVGTGQA